MKTLLLLASIIALCPTTPQSLAQADVLPPTITPQPYRLPELTLGKGEAAELAKALEILAMHLRATGEEVPNVILGAGTEQLPVPSLTLRNISGLDAVQMIATAAGCELDRVAAAEDPSRTAGWLIRVKVRPPATAGFGFGGGEVGVGSAAPGGLAGRSGGMAPGGAPPFAAPGAVNTVQFTSRSADAPGSGGMPGGAGGQPRAGHSTPQGTIVSFGAPTADPSAAMTMVYPVGGLLTEGKAADAMSALEDALKTAIESAGLAGEKPRLSFHEKTKVLIIKGSQELQQLVGSFLEALEKNRVNASAGELAQARNEIARSRDVADLREKEMSMQLKRLEVQIAELDSERRALRRHAEELEAKLPKVGPPAETPRR